MKKVLIIADLQHASPRIPSVAKFFPEFGWEPIVLTGHPPEAEDQTFRVILTPFPDSIVEWKKRLFMNPREGFQKQLGVPFSMREKKWSFSAMLINLCRGIILYPDANKKWRRIAVEAANELCRREDIDAIISSSSPVTSHLIAQEISKKWNIPWIADLRDLWTQNHNYHYGYTRRFIEQRLELKTLKTADAIVTVSPLWAADLEKLHRLNNIYSITNGFDPDLLCAKKNDLTSKFSITYTGPIYTGKHDTSEFLSALSDLVTKEIIDRKDVEVRFYGPQDELLQQQIERNKLTDIVTQYGLIPRESSFEKQRESQLLLLLYWNDPEVKGWYPLKGFEYLASQRPILVTGGTGGDVVEKLMHQTKAGLYCRNRMEIIDRLSQLYLEYKEKGRIDNSKIDINEINKFNYKNAANKFTVILNDLIKKRG